MFCPNCGTQNESAATPCKKCGFKLSGISVPKFKGTMMLNSDQTVQELIEEHRRKAQGAAAEKNKGRASEPAPKRAPGSSAPPSSLGGPRGPVLQPPRAAPPTRGRMGGTMMGVAPQGGAVVPPVGARAPVTPKVPPSPDEPRPADARARQLDASAVESERAELDASRADASRSDAAAEPVPAPRLEPDSDDDRTPRPAAARPPAPTRPLAAVPSASPEASWASADASDGARDEVPDAPEPAEPARARAVPVTAPLPQQPPPPPPALATAADGAEASGSPPPRLRPLDLVLIVCTFGLYGIVLWVKRRKPAAA